VLWIEKKSLQFQFIVKQEFGSTSYHGRLIAVENNKNNILIHIYIYLKPLFLQLVPLGSLKSWFSFREIDLSTNLTPDTT